MCDKVARTGKNYTSVEHVDKFKICQRLCAYDWQSFRRIFNVIIPESRGGTMREESNLSEYVMVYIAQGMLRAMSIRGCLESASIPVALNYETPSLLLVPLQKGKGVLKSWSLKNGKMKPGRC